MDAREQTAQTIEQFLRSKVPFWYPRKNIELMKIGEYTDFNDHHHRNILCTRYALKQIAAKMTIEKQYDGLQVKVMRIDPRDDGKKLIDILKENVILTDLNNISFMAMAGDAIDYEADLTTENYKKKVLVTFANDEIDTLQIRKMPYEMHIPLPHDLFQDVKATLQAALEHYSCGVTQGLQRSEEATVNGVHLTYSTQISTVNVDCSIGDDTVFNWWECGFREQCTTMAPLSEQESSALLASSNLTLPRDAVPVGFSPAPPGEQPQCYIVRLIHAIPDTTAEFGEDQHIYHETFPAEYSRPGRIIIEGDYCVYYIDPVNKRVIGESRKWHTVNDLQFKPEKCTPPEINAAALIDPPETERQDEDDDEDDDGDDS